MPLKTRGFILTCVYREAGISIYYIDSSGCVISVYHVHVVLRVFIAILLHFVLHYIVIQEADI